MNAAIIFPSDQISCNNGLQGVNRRAAQKQLVDSLRLFLGRPQTRHYAGGSTGGLPVNSLWTPFELTSGRPLRYQHGWRLHSWGTPLGLTPGGRIFFWTHFRLSLWMAMHLRMRRATPSVYLDLWGVRVYMTQQNDCQEDCTCKKSWF